MRLPNLVKAVVVPSGIVMKGRIVPAAYKGACYFHHNCPEDGYIDTVTKRRCADGGGYSWLNKAGGCENLRK